MGFRDYCIVFMGDTEGCIKSLTQLSENDPRILNAKGILIATFTSALKVNEITEYYKMEEKNFLLFELDDKSSGYNITKKHIYDGLFAFLDERKGNEDRITQLFRNPEMRGTKISTKNLDVETVKDEYNLTEEEIEKMVPSEKQEMINKLIDSGIENLTEEHKKILQLLSK